jgi:hypothetical protein
MRTGITFDATAADRTRLNAIIGAPTSAQKHVWRAKIILLSGQGLGTAAILQATGNLLLFRWSGLADCAAGRHAGSAIIGNAADCDFVKWCAA